VRGRGGEGENGGWIRGADGSVAHTCHFLLPSVRIGYNYAEAERRRKQQSQPWEVLEWA
jgi:hypothetical protein